MDWAIRLLGATAFGIGAFAASVVYGRERRDRDGARFARLWLAQAIVLAIVALQLSTKILTQIVNLVRFQAFTHSWYAERRPYQIAAIVLFLAIGLTLFLETLIWLRPVRARYLLAAIALLYNSLFLAITSVSLHQVDAILNWKLLFHLGQWGYFVGLTLTAGSLYLWRLRTIGLRPA